MARQKKFKKTQMPKALKGAKEFILSRMIGIIVMLVFVALAWILVTAFLERSDYFRVRSVDVKGAADISLISIRSELLRHYRDKNIFKINLAAIASELEPKYPDAREIIVKRELPDKLTVDLKFRKPFALLSNGRVYPVDREGVMLVNMDASKLKDFPIIKGVDTVLAGKAHKKNESKKLEVALELLDEIKRSKFLEKYNIRLIDASDIKTLSFYLGDSGPSVIIGYEDFKYRLEALRDTLKDPRMVPDKINYIDVRFKEVAISPK